MKSYIEQASESFDHFIQSKEFTDSVDRVEKDKELMQYAEKLARNPTAPIDNEIQKLLENKYDDRY